MGHFAQPDRAAQLAPLAQQRDQTAVIGPQGLAQHQEGEELRLGVVVSGPGTGIGGQGGLSHGEGLAGQPDRGFRHRAHGNLHEGCASLLYASGP